MTLVLSEETAQGIVDALDSIVFFFRRLFWLSEVDLGLFLRGRGLRLGWRRLRRERSRHGRHRGKWWCGQRSPLGGSYRLGWTRRRQGWGSRRWNRRRSWFWRRWRRRRWWFDLRLRRRRFDFRFGRRWWGLRTKRWRSADFGRQGSSRFCRRLRLAA